MSTILKCFIVKKESLGGSTTVFLYTDLEREIGNFMRENRLEIVSITEHQKGVVWVVFKEKRRQRK